MRGAWKMPEIAKLNEQVHTLFANDDRVTRDMEALRRDVQDCNRDYYLK